LIRMCRRGQKKEFLTFTVLETETKTQEGMDKISAFLETEKMQWEKLSGLYMEEAPTMLGSKSASL